MATKNSGSALILMLIILSALLLVGISVWRSTAYLIDIAQDYQHHQEYQQLVTAGIRWGVAFIQHNTQSVHDALEENQHLSLSFKQWPDELSPYSLSLVMQQQAQDQLSIVAELRQENHIIKRLSTHIPWPHRAPASAAVL